MPAPFQLLFSLLRDGYMLMHNAGLMSCLYSFLRMPNALQYGGIIGLGRRALAGDAGGSQRRVMNGKLCRQVPQTRPKPADVKENRWGHTFGFWILLIH
jgi:hypothetical protein